MKQGWHKILTAALVLALLLTTLPSLVGWEQAQAAGAYGKVTAQQVLVRKQPGTNTNYWFKLDTGSVCEILDVQSVDQITWYKVNAEHPSDIGRTYIGYIHGDFFMPMTAEEIRQWEEGKNPGVVTTPPMLTPGIIPGAPGNDGLLDAVLTGAYGVVTAGETNFRQYENGPVLARLSANTEVELLSIPLGQDSSYWYRARYQGMVGYIQAPFIRVTNYGSYQMPETQILGYVQLTKSTANLRESAGGQILGAWTNRGEVLPYISFEVRSDYTWYQVVYQRASYYVRSDCVITVDNAGSVAPAPTPTPGAAAAPEYVVTTTDGVNLRLQPSGEIIMQLPRGTVVPCVGDIAILDGVHWYYVQYGNIRGYIHGDYARACTIDGSVVTPAPTTPPVTVEPAYYGYVKMTAAGVNVRISPAGESKAQLAKGVVVPVIGAKVTSGSYDWYPVRTDGGITGYVRGDCVEVLSYVGTTPTPTPNTSTLMSNYLITTTNALNLRQSASKDSKALFNVDQGTVMAWNDQVNVGGVVWYRVIYQNTEVWVMGKYTALMTQAEYDAWQALNPDKAPQTHVRVGYIKTTASGVNLRTTANGDTIITRVDKGTVLPYLASPTVVGKTHWYYVELTNGIRGYLHGDYVTVCDMYGNEINDPSDGKQEASYTTLRKGSQGDAVRRLVTELKNQGYYAGSITSSYTSEVENAVKAFQRAKGLTVDGVAGSDTQHALFNTVPEGSGDSGLFGTGDLTMKLYPAEKIDWWTGGIQKLWAKGDDYKVYDVKTGIVWWAHRWSGGNHADIEPLTAADSARLCKIYGVSSTAEIKKLDLWRRRPSLVTIGNRTFACSLYGVPHNEDGDTIPDNDMVGQICLHFTNSKTHDTDMINTPHQEAIEYAWLNSPSGHK